LYNKLKKTCFKERNPQNPTEKEGRLADYFSFFFLK